MEEPPEVGTALAWRGGGSTSQGGDPGRGGPGCVPGPGTARSGQPVAFEDSAPRICTFSRSFPLEFLLRYLPVLFIEVHFSSSEGMQAPLKSAVPLSTPGAEERTPGMTLGVEMTPEDCPHSIGICAPRRFCNHTSLGIRGNSRYVFGGDPWVFVKFLSPCIVISLLRFSSYSSISFYIRVCVGNHPFCGDCRGYQRRIVYSFPM